MLSSITRFDSLDELLAVIKEQQNFAILKKGLKSIGFGSKPSPAIRLGASNASGDDRYILYIADVPKILRAAPDRSFAVFIVPQGRYLILSLFPLLQLSYLQNLLKIEQFL